MAITTYEFYTAKYWGDSIPDDAFSKFESRAEDEFHLLTCGRMKEAESFSEEIQKAVCSLAEVLYRIEVESHQSGVTEDGKGKIVKAVSSGGESISYDVQKSEFSTAVMDKKVRNMLCYEAVRTYLSGTGLLYWGI